MSASERFFRQFIAIVRKDLRTEWRTREMFSVMFVFTILVLVVFNFAIGANLLLIRQVAAGVLWVALLFATVLGLQRAAQLESTDECLQGVLVTLGDRSVLFVAKTVGNWLLLLVVAVCTLPLFSIWLRIDILAQWQALGLTLGLGMLGLSIVGTLFSLLVLNIRMREVMLPLLFLPVSVPLIIASVYATEALLAGKDMEAITDYLTLIGVFDVVFFVLGWLVFDFIVEE